MQTINIDEKIDKIEKVGLVIRPNTHDLHKYYKQIKNKLDLYGVQLILDGESAFLLGVEGVEFDKMCQMSDIIISLGGDGTLISVSRRSFKYNKPILGVNIGKLGFLVDIDVKELENFIDKLFKNEYRIDRRMVLEVIFHKKEDSLSAFAFNDIVFSRPMVAGMVDLQAFVDDVHFNNYYGDGLIVSTPTGSTAYNLSSGGPVVFPLTEALILTPLCSHSLTQRPLILPADFKVKIKSSDKVLVAIDGQDIYHLEDYESIEFKMATKGVRLIHRVERNYFKVLKEKLKWGDA